MEPTLYEQLGGENGIEKAVEHLYAKVAGDPRLASFFNGADMILLKRKFRLFMNTVSGGPRKRSTIELRAAHSNAVKDGLNEEHIVIFVEYLRASLTELNVPASTIGAVVAAMYQAQDHVLGR